MMKWARKISQASVRVEWVKMVIWRFENQLELENERILRRNVGLLRKNILAIVQSHSVGLNEGKSIHLAKIAQRISDAVERGLSGSLGKDHEKRSLLQACLSLVSLASDIKALDIQISSLAQEKRRVAQVALSKMGRDQLILFLVLLFAIPIFVGFIPRSLVAPLMRLKGVRQGRLREIVIAGHDKIFNITCTIKKALIW